MRCLALLVGLLVTPGVFAATFTVSKTADTNDGVCDADCSLREAIGAANASGVPDTIAFAIPVADPGYNAGTGVFTIAVGSQLPTITGNSTTIDGTTQTTNVGDTNPLIFGTGGTVGVGADGQPSTGDELALSQLAAPEIEIQGAPGINFGLLATASGVTIRGLAIYGFGNTNGEASIRIDGNNGLVEQNVVGSTAASFSDPGAALRGHVGIHIEGSTTGTIRNNLVGFLAVRGIWVMTATNGWTIEDNEIRDAGLSTMDGDGIAINGAPSNTMRGNLIVGSSSQGFIVTVAGSNNNNFNNNTVSGNGVGIPSGVSQSAGITMRSSAGPTVIDRNLVTANYGAGLAVNSAASGMQITRNSFSANGTIVARDSSPATGQIGIDLNAPGDNNNFGTPPFYTINDSGDGDTGGNTLLNFPIIDTASIFAGNLTLTGWARPGSVIEFFIAAADPTGFGEGGTYLTTLTEGSGADTDATTSSYGPGPINGISQGTDNTNRYSFTIPTPAGVGGGTILTATATIGANTSEFSGVVTATITPIISGRVFEDTDFAGTASAYDGGAVDIPLPNVDVELYTSADAYISSTVTDASGNFQFTVADGDYKVRVRSATIGDSNTVPAGGFNAACGITDPATGVACAVAEQTWGDASAAVGGQDPAADDTATDDNAGPGDTWLAVSIAGADKTGLDYGFAYNPIVNTNDTGQGSLRRFILNANAIGSAGGTTANSSEFAIPGAGPHTIQPLSALPVIDDPIVIDGYTQSGAQANTVASPGATDAVLLIEIDGTNAGAGADGLEITAGGSRVSGLVINRFNAAGLALTGGTAHVVTGNYLGTSVSGLSGDVGNDDEGLQIALSTNNIIGGAAPADRNVISGNRQRGIWINDFSDGPGIASDSNVILGNYIGVDAAGTATVPYSGALFQQIGIAVWDGPDHRIGGTAAGEGNVISGNSWYGIYSFGTNSNGMLIRGNIIGLDAPATAAVPNGSESATRSAINLSGAPNNRIGGTAAGEPNIIAGNASKGVVLTGATALSNAIVSNSIYSNTGIGIDLGSDGVTLNDAGDPDAGSNDLLNFPVITWAGAGVGTVTAEFDLDVPAGDYRIEFFANPGGAHASGYGEGESLAGSTTLSHPGGGPQSYSTSFPGAIGDILTATTTFCSDGPACTTFGATSEFSASITAISDLAITKAAYFPDGTPIPTGATIADGVQFYFVLYLNNRGAARSDVSIRDILDPAFAYQAGSILSDNSVPACAGVSCTPVEEAAIVAAVLGGSPGTDGIDGDAVSYSGGLPGVDVGNENVANQQLDIAANRVYAVAFTAKMQ